MDRIDEPMGACVVKASGTYCSLYASFKKSAHYFSCALNVFQNTGSNQIEGQRAGPSDCSGWLNHRAQNRTKGPMTSTGIFNAGVLDNFFEVVSSFCGATGYLTVEGWFLPSAPKPG